MARSHLQFDRSVAQRDHLSHSLSMPDCGASFGSWHQRMNGVAADADIQGLQEVGCGVLLQTARSVHKVLTFVHPVIFDAEDLDR